MLARAPLRQNPARRDVVRTDAVAAPVKGWNTEQPLASMDKMHAVELVNWFPQPGYIEVRRGYTEHAHSVGAVDDPVETLMVWNGAASTRKMFAASGGSIYNVTASGSPTADLTSLTSDRWQWVNFTNSGTTYLYAVNGADSARHYNGSAWAAPSITNVSSSDLIHINVHKKRLWFTQKDTTKAWYLATDAIAGAATSFELGSNFTRGGYLVGMATWTRDGGSGPDDYAVFVSSRGQAAIYQGTDPASADTWSIVGVFDIPVPIGRRCFLNYGSDVLLITLTGVYPLTQLFAVDQSQGQAVAITKNISNAINSASRSYKDNFGWQLVSYPKGTRLILNIPTSESETARQFVMNTLTGAWCEFNGHNANCWVEFNDAIYFGDSAGHVYKADTGSLDDEDPITAEGQTSYQSFGNPGRLKRFSMVQPLINVTGTVRPSIGISTDFVETSTLSTPSGATEAGASWDSAVWDIAEWGGGAVNVNDWTSTPGLGRFASIRFHMTVGGSVVSSVWGESRWGLDRWGTTGNTDPEAEINGFVVLIEQGSYL